MKRSAIVGIVVLAAAALIPQTLDAGVGIKGGYSLAKALWKTDALEGVPFAWGNLPSFTGGLYFNINFGVFSLQPEVLYVRMGGRYEDGEDFLDFRFDYIQVPLLLRINIIAGGPVRPFLYGGGYGAYLLKATGISFLDGIREETDIKEDYQVFDYGALGGVGLAFHLPGVAITIEGRYNYGLRNLFVDTSEGWSMNNTAMMALVGIQF